MMEYIGPIEREHVFSELAKISDKGVRHPDQLDDSDPETAQAFQLFFGYAKQRQDYAKSIGTQEAELETSLDLSTVRTDAGFNDPEYIDEVVNDWLAQDEQKALNNDLEELAVKIRNKTIELKSKIGE